MKRHLYSTLTVSALVTACALIAPQVFAHGPAHMFDKFDENRDGKVTRTEAHSKVLEHFRSVDANNDKSLTPEEAQKHRAAKMKERGNPEKFIEAQFKANDTNKNGQLERSESQLPDKIFARLDKNGDGAITKQEALDAHRDRMAKKAERRNSQGKDRDGRAKSHEKRGGSPILRADTNGDGAISEAEAIGAADQVFSRIDQNKDNVVTRAEVSELRKDHRSPKRGKGHEKKRK